jgi:hypothetical protein
VFDRIVDALDLPLNENTSASVLMSSRLRTLKNMPCDTEFRRVFAESAEKRCPITPKLVEFGYD